MWIEGVKKKGKRRKERKRIEKKIWESFGIYLAFN